MQSTLATLDEIVSSLNVFVWNYTLIYLLIGVGLWFTVRLRFIQFRHFTHMFTIMKHSRGESSFGISSFQALCTTLAARVGTGNLAGVAVAISLGGAGAVFWMWIIALLGMATSFAECTLAQLYKRKTEEGTFKGGPAYYMTQGAKKPLLAALYSGCLFFGYGFVFSMVQSNTISDAFAASYDIQPLHSGIFVTLLTAVIVLGGLRSIARFAEYVVPFMALSYLAVTLYVLMLNITLLPEVITQIVTSAFGWQEAGGGLVGAAIVQGVKRGLYSNEAGTGSAPNAAAAADPVPPHPVSQGYVQMLGVVVDTLVICSCTAFIILLGGAGQQEQMEGIRMTQNALVHHVGPWGSDFISLSIFFFCITSIVANYAYAENSLSFVKLNNKPGKWFFRTGFLVMVLVGSVATLPQVIAMADLAFGLMAILNIISLFLLSKTIVYITRHYNQQLHTSSLPQYKPDANEQKQLNLFPDSWK